MIYHLHVTDECEFSITNTLEMIYFLFSLRGQILSTDCLTNTEDVELINEGFKYCLKVSMIILKNI